MPALSVNYGDLLNPSFRRIYDDEYGQLPDFISRLYTIEGSDRNQEKYSSIGTMDDWSEFSGTVVYDDVFQGHDTTVIHKEFAKGFQIERKLFDDDQFGIMNQRPKGLARSAQRTRQKHAARMLNNGFSVDTYFYNNTEAVALFSNSHTTTSGASTASGFDNLGTAALSAVAVSAARISMVNQRDDRAGRISIIPDEIWIPPDLFEEAFEIVSSMGKVDTANNNRNVHEGVYTIVEWNYMDDANNWMMFDSSMRKDNFIWIDRVPIEFAMAEDIDTLVAKFRAYGRWSNLHRDWRGTHGSQVS